MTRKEHWGDRRRRRWDDIIGATCMTPFFFLDPSSGHWDDKKGATRMTKKEHWDDIIGALEDTITE